MTIDISDKIEDFEIPVCPLCDNCIQDYEPGTVVTAHGANALAHTMCVETMDDNAEEGI